MAKRKIIIPPLPRGFAVSGVASGIKSSAKLDMTLLVSDVPCHVAGVFTRNRCVAAPIMVNRKHLRNARCQAVVINSGNANASTGKTGVKNATEMCQCVAEHLDMTTADVLVASTGIIGVPLPMHKITRGIATLTTKLGRSRTHVEAAARGIMTTDLTFKLATRRITVGPKRIRLTGLTKGSGMIAPNMGTMLAFIMTDAKLSPATLRTALRHATEKSFNRISVDQHTSPSDAVLVMANGKAGTCSADRFTAALTDLCHDLAEQLVRDGEGATKLMRVRVTGARSEREADRVAKAVVDSPLVKTALHGGDPNWGRTITAAGYSGVAVNPDQMTLTFKAAKKGSRSITVFRHGQPVSITDTAQHQLQKIMQGDEVVFMLELKRGKATTEWLGCDLSRQYITINADYTT